ncbi:MULTISPECIES: hypothetical protein [Hydrocarboniphaga]|uniref:Uncharacterized protein n=1 Tax=Hydrocarboniphaga effusa AP103 TaxID=1172194 RepID=I7ZAV3_9GAMM|nr:MULTISPECIES: hypothetical protein [Hydrocarboniphaga]EIT68964.1 hypothetical protein WQQ_25460 [Hydrocarboniphaga effusa AP103]MDZ4081155.1 hypothetical protein [Hydrocarboniphaga sp.]
MKHLLIAIPVLLLALALYVVGFGSGAIALIGIGAVLEAGVWLGLFHAGRNRTGTA